MQPDGTLDCLAECDSACCRGSERLHGLTSSQVRHFRPYESNPRNGVTITPYTEFIFFKRFDVDLNHGCPLVNRNGCSLHESSDIPGVCRALISGGPNCSAWRMARGYPDTWEEIFERDRRTREY